MVFTNINAEINTKVYFQMDKRMEKDNFNIQMDNIERKEAIWFDQDDEKIQVNLNKKNRLKKLKQGEESIISGKSLINQKVLNFRTDLEINIQK